MSDGAEVLRTALMRDGRPRSVPVVRVGLSGVEAVEAVGVPVVVGALMQAGVAI